MTEFTQATFAVILGTIIGRCLYDFAVGFIAAWR